jgi:hypothetical protein
VRVERPDYPDLSLPELLQRVRDRRYFSLQRPATPSELAVGEAAWRRWFGIAMPPVYRDLLAASNGVNFNGLFLCAAEEYVVVEDGRERWMPGLETENSGYLYGIAEQETRRFFGSADDDLFAYDTASGRWLVVDRVNWPGDPILDFATLEDLLVDRMFCYLDEADDGPGRSVGGP